jgi:homogentisate 1,2-dioxygenase
LATPFGRIEVSAGDFVVVPRGVTQSWEVIDGPLALLVLEAAGHVGVPPRYLSPRGQFLEGAPMSERSLRGPALGEPRRGPAEVLVRNRGGWTALDHEHHPFDVVGWDGALYPWAFNVADFEPIVGASHQPPPVHQVFAGAGFVVCVSVPRPLDFGEGATKVPYHHSNADSDEVLFYSSGDFTSRSGSGIAAGSISYHPAGFVHGPHPGAVAAAEPQERTEEVAVMVDTFRPLGVTEAARAISAPEYPGTWAV